jgi:hypothetical protein
VEDTMPTSLSVAVSYVQAGWAVIPVYGVGPDGICRCRDGGGCMNSGKHPIQRGWTKGEALSVADLYAIWDEHPDANVGLRTGDISRMWVLDVEAAGLEDLAALEAIHGALPDTYTVGTGGGGRHYFFEMPDFPVRNNARKLAPHIDVRGTGGQVVAPPSRSGKGVYQVLNGVPGRVPRAPGWLEDMLRQPTSAPEVTAGAVIEDLPRHDELTPSDRRRAERYAATVLDDECGRYVHAPPGSGNAQLFASACNALEIAQSPWNVLTVGDVYDALNAARTQRVALHPYGGGQSDEEFGATFRSARGQVIGQGRELPPDPLDGVMFDPGPEYSRSTNSSFLVPAVPAAPPLTLLERLRAELLTADQVADRPNPRPLVNGLLDLDSEAWMIGKPGTFKSFVALDLAGHIGQGKEWGGRRVHQGTVLYVVAEGVTGMTLRVRAWKERYGDMPGVYFMPRPVQSGGNGAVTEGWRALTELARELKPVLVVIDTQARVTVGLNENAATDLGIYIEAVRMMREATSACVLTIHHIGRNGTDARGSNAIDGAQGTELRLDRKSLDDMYVNLIMDKQKDMADGGDPIKINMLPYDGGVDLETGRELTSLVATAGDMFGQPAKSATDWAAEIDAETQDNAKLVIQVLADTFGEAEDFTEAAVKAACVERWKGQAGWGPGSIHKTWRRSWGRLGARYVVERVSAGRWRHVPVEDRPTSVPELS